MGLLDRVHTRGAAVGIFADDSMKVAYGLLSGVLPGGMGIPPARGTPEYLRAYSSMPWLRAVTGRIANAVARADWQLFVLKASPSRASRTSIIQRAAPEYRRRMLKQAVDTGDLAVVQPDHPLLVLLNQANEFQTGLAMRKVTQLHLDLVGDGFWLKERDGQNTPVGVWPIPPHWIMATPTPSFRFFRVSFRAWRGNIPDTEFVWFSDPDPLNPYGRGTGATQAITDELETDEYAARMTKAFFYNQAKPDLLIWPKGGQGITDANIKRLEEDWMSKAQGFFRAFKPYFLGREVEVKELDMNFRTLQLIQLRQFERDLILQQFGVPPEILGVLEHCVDDETECLTRRGWVKQEQLSGDDNVATWNQQKSQMEYQRPTEIHRYWHDGSMHHWRSNRLNFKCTLGHRLWMKREEHGEFSFVTSQDAEVFRAGMYWRVTGGRCQGSKTEVVLPGHWHGNARPENARHRCPPPIATSISVEAFAPFLGYWLAEGWADKIGARSYGVFYGQNEGETAERMAAAFNALDLGDVTERTKPNKSGTIQNEYRLASRSLWEWLVSNAGITARTKRIPDEVFDWPLSTRKALLDAFLEGDGSTKTRASGRRTIRVGVMSERLIDDLQHLCVQLGLRAAKKPTADSDGMWSIVITEAETQWLDRYGSTQSKPTWCETVQYRGKVWCVTVPNGLFFTRRNGRVVVHGNSNRSTIDAADYLMNRYVVEPRLEFLRTVLQERFVPEFDEKLIIEYASPVQEDRAAQAAAATAAPWALSIDEHRAMAGQKPMEDEVAGALHMVPNLVTPMSVESLVSPPPKPAPAMLPPGGAPPSLPPDLPPKRAIMFGSLTAIVLDDVSAALDAGDRILGDALLKATSLDLDALPEASALAARQEPALVRLLVRAWRDHAARISVSALEAALGPSGVHGDVMAAIDLHGLAVAQTAALQPSLVRGFLRGAELGVRILRRHGVPVRRAGGVVGKPGQVAVDFEAVNPLAVAWAQAHAADLIDVPTDVQETIRALIAQSIADGIPPAELARMIRNVIGLDERRAEAVNHFQTRLAEDETVTAASRASRVARYAAAQQSDRAITIARTELIGALNRGQQALWGEAVGQGVIQAEQFEQVWLTTDDDAICDECEPLGDTTAEIGGTFEGGDEGPPLHPQCRCAVGLQAVEEKAARVTPATPTVIIHNHLAGATRHVIEHDEHGRSIALRAESSEC